MTQLAGDTPPTHPICRSAEDAQTPCRFAGTCHETRQRIAHYQTPPLRGTLCWAFGLLMERPRAPEPDVERELERAAIATEEGNA